MNKKAHIQYTSTHYVQIGTCIQETITMTRAKDKVCHFDIICHFSVVLMAHEKYIHTATIVFHCIPDVASYM